MSSFTKLMSDYGIGALIALVILAYAISLFGGYLSHKGSAGSETMESTVSNQYKKNAPSVGGAPQPSEPLGQNEVFSTVKGVAGPPVAGGCAKPTIQNPEELLPKDNKSEWAQLNPSGKGELSNINLLRAGAQIGVDTVGQSLRNANLQLRSETPNPQLYTGPWNLSTIEPDFMRPPLEIAQGSQ